MVDIFISYSRKDKNFVQTLHQALSQSRYDTWVDWEDIPASATWWQVIEAAIEAAHTCIGDYFWPGVCADRPPYLQYRLRSDQ